MAAINITQLRRLVFRKWDADANTWDVFTFEADDLGQDTVMTVNVAPRMRSRASSLGTAETAITGTFDAFAGSVTFLLDNFKKFGQAIQMWNEATYAGADANAGNIVWDGSDLCGDGTYFSVVAQGICDDGSSADVELTRCMPSVDDDIEIGISHYRVFTADKPHMHPVATEHSYVLQGSMKMRVLDGSGEELRFDAGDFFVLRPGVGYATKNAADTKILFIKAPGINDKTEVEIDEETARWLSSWE